MIETDYSGISGFSGYSVQPISYPYAKYVMVDPDDLRNLISRADQLMKENQELRNGEFQNWIKDKTAVLWERVWKNEYREKHTVYLTEDQVLLLHARTDEYKKKLDKIPNFIKKLFKSI